MALSAEGHAEPNRLWNDDRHHRLMISFHQEDSAQLDFRRGRCGSGRSSFIAEYVAVGDKFRRVF